MNSGEHASLSISRGLHHLVDDVSFSPAALGEFYQDLPIKDKPSLKSLHIHLSAADASFAGGQSYGLYNDGPVYNPARLGAPELQRVNRDSIVIYVGSAVLDVLLSAEPYDTETLSRRINTTATHELTHFAQRGGYEPPEDWLDQLFDRERYVKMLLHNQLSEAKETTRFYSRPITGFMVGALAGALTHRRSSILTGALIGGLAGGMLHARDADERTEQLRDEGMAEYEADEDEQEANAHQTGDCGIFTITPRAKNEILELRHEDFRSEIDYSSGNRSANSRVRKIALTPRGELAKNRYTTQ